MKIGVFGGTFNPPHIGHLILAECALMELKLDKIIFVPSVGSPAWYKENPIVSFNDRIVMILYATMFRNEFEISSDAAECGNVTHTAEVLKKMGMLNKNTVLLMGPDAYSTFWEWNNFEEISSACHSIAVACKDFYMPDINIRSSDIREMIRNGKPIRHMVPEFVINYIKMKGFYKE